MATETNPVISSFKVGIKAAFGDYLFEEYAKWVALNPDSETRGQWNPKFTLG